MLRNAVKWFVFKCLYPLCYYIGSRHSVRQNKAVFVESHGNELSDNYTLLYSALNELEFDTHVHMLRISESGWFKIIIRTMGMIWDVSTAQCVLLDESNSAFGAFKIRKGTSLIQMWHACGAFKKWGYSVTDKTFGEDKQTLDQYNGHRNYSLVAVSGRNVCWAYEEAFGLDKDSGIVKPIGVSRTDVFFDDNRKREALFKISNLDIKIDGRKIIIYLPTFRGSISMAQTSSPLDIGILSELGDEYVFIVKQHPFVKKPLDIPERYRDYIIEVSDNVTTYELIMASDVCITDYSSIVFEYSLMHRPIVFFAYDLEEYYDERGFYYPYEEFVPGPIVKNTRELVDIIHDIDMFDYNKLDEFRAKFMDGCDGHSTERLIKYIRK